MRNIDTLHSRPNVTALCLVGSSGGHALCDARSSGSLGTTLQVGKKLGQGELAGRRGLSALINDALRVRLQHVRVGRLLNEMDEEFGPVPPAIEEEVRSTWPAAGRSPSG